jgi:outer membrane protein TolC
MHRSIACFKIYIVAQIIFLPAVLLSQSMDLDKAYALARENYPLIKQKNLIRQTEQLNVNNLSKGYLPQLSINGQLSYQSEVTSIDVNIPGFKFDPPSKDQYKVTADVDQLIYDGGMTKQQKSIQQLNAVVEDQQIEIELYKLKERINQVYLSILYLDEQVKQVDLIKQDLQTGLKKIEAQVQNGVAFRSNVNILKAELIKADQRLIELNASRKGLIETLSLFINLPVSLQTSFARPVVNDVADTLISRPEIKLFSDQYVLLGQQNKLIRSRNLPRTSLFFQGGYGKPALNFLKNEFEPYYVTGLRFHWTLGGLYSKRNEENLVKINQDIVNLKREVFLLNTNAEIKKQRSEIDKLNQLIDGDNQIIDLRKSVTNSAKAQLENGVITANDYLREVNAEDQSRQNLIGHEIQLLQAKMNYQTTMGR